ncbi:MAG: dihydrolipoyl dehydrogenase [Candidatus Aenigmarchaeota archaeon]|nr:dihydrolipoyl dehydrogenase [Candidatus Aenigmarchaeota archaeon]
MMDTYDVVVIGGGPGGYTAAIRVAQLGGRIVLIEKNKLGGVCNNYGCIPSKTMLRLADIISSLKTAKNFGVNITKSDIDIKKLVKNRKDLIDKLASGVEILLKSNNVKIIFGEAYLKEDKSVVVKKEDSAKEVIRAKNIIIATGSRPSTHPIKINSKNVVNSEEFLTSEELPDDILIIGGGPEGIEFACMLSALGCKVSIVEMMDRLLPTEDREISHRMEKIVLDNHVKILTRTKVVEIKDDGNYTNTKFDNGSNLKTKKVLISIGRKPNSENLGLEQLNVKATNGKIIVNDKMETSIKGIYAIGDVTGGRFAHEAMENGIVAAENAMKLNSSMNQIIPRCIYSIPEVASVGLTEEEAKRKYNILVGTFNFKSSGRAMTMGDTNGFVKVIIEKKSRKFIGIHILADRASDMIGEALLAMKVTADDIIRTVHPHPTLVESIREAVLDAYGRAIHSLNQNKKHTPKSLKHYV